GQRGRGIGKALVHHALDFLDRQGVQSVRLDATPLGQPLYEKLGFMPEYTLKRFEGTFPTLAAGWPGLSLRSPGMAATNLEGSPGLRRLSPGHPAGSGHSADPAISIQPLLPAHEDEMLLLDRSITQTDRRTLLLRLP